MAKTYNTTIVFKDENQEPLTFANDPIVYQQAHSHQDIHTFVDNGGETIEPFIPWGAVAYFTFTIEESETPAPEDAFCAE